MRIIFVRHGEPDYEHDCLTETGHLQAAAAAERLADEGISEIYASPYGRAQQTASYTAKKLGLPIITLEFMHEIGWGGPGVPCDGHPWTLSDWMMQEGFNFYSDNWREHPYFKENVVTEHYDRVSGAFDTFLETLGYRREGNRFKCLNETNRTVALFSHGGSGAIVLARLLDLPFPWVISRMEYGFTSIIIVSFPDTPGEYCFPRLDLFNDLAHIRGLSSGIVLQQKQDESKFNQ